MGINGFDAQAPLLIISRLRKNDGIVPRREVILISRHFNLRDCLLTHLGSDGESTDQEVGRKELIDLKGRWLCLVNSPMLPSD